PPTREITTLSLHDALPICELSVWPALTGAETLEYLGRLHGSFDAAYRDELCQRFDFDPSKKSRAYSKGNRQKIGLIAALMTRAEDRKSTRLNSSHVKISYA